MLGNFLEFGLAGQPVAEAFEFYRSMGFQPVAVGDILEHPYAVVSDGDVCIGLHEWEREGPVLTFVRPDLSDYVRALRRQRIELEFAHLATDEFNELGFRDPNGQLVTLLEARTFSPGSWLDHERSVCGRFLEFSLATRSAGESRDFWAPLGMEVVEEGEDPHHWIRLQGRGLTVGFHESSTFVSGLTFAADDVAARIAYMKAKGVELTAGSPLRRAPTESATLAAPGGGRIFLVAAPP